MFLDATAVGLVGVAALSQSEGPAAFAIGTSLFMYSLGPPIVHYCHGNYGRSLGSFGLRWGLPLAAGLTSLALFGPDSNSQSEMADVAAALVTLAGAGVGLVGAIIIDSSLLAWDYPKTPVTATSVKPIIGATKDQVSFNLAGTF